jgi:pyruvate dehydrogenase E2 component (dihydrolipoamide acetyltransferase)
MASEVAIPRLGWNMEEGTFVGWLKNDGDRVAAGEPLFTLEGDKATQEIESIEAGLLRICPRGPREGDKVTVGTIIGYLVAPGELPPFDAGTAVTCSPLPDAVPGSSKQRISPRARRVARELAIDARGLTGSGKSGRVLERDVRAAARARTGPRASSDPNLQPLDTPQEPRAAPSREYDEINVSAIRKTIAERMLHSRATTAAVTITTTVDATNLVNLRQQFKAVAEVADEAPIGYTEIVIKLTALALEKHPRFNSTWNNEKIVVWRNVHIGIAVDTDAGLIVPVVRDVGRLSLRQLAAQTRALIDRARGGTLAAAEMQGGTFTVTNLGPLGIEIFTPLINPPECAILGVGRIEKQVVVEDTQFIARERMTLCLTFDHRIADGAPAARFLQSLGRMIEKPSPWLLP